MTDVKNNKTALKLATIAVCMFGFGYLLVPLYNVFCEVTGLNGKTGSLSVSQAETIKVDESREITVLFDTNVNSELPWQFEANTRKISIRPGELNRVTFSITNLGDRSITGQAIPSVTPSRGSIYFNKTECFCFSQQELKPGEHKEMTVSFIVEPELPDTIRMLTLSYTYFETPDSVTENKNHEHNNHHGHNDHEMKFGGPET